MEKAGVKLKEGGKGKGPKCKELFEFERLVGEGISEIERDWEGGDKGFSFAFGVN